MSVENLILQASGLSSVLLEEGITNQPTRLDTEQIACQEMGEKQYIHQVLVEQGGRSPLERLE